MQHTAPNPPASNSVSDIAPSSFANPTGRIAIVAGNGPSLAQIDYTRLPPPPRKPQNLMR